MINFIQALWRGWQILIRNYVDVVNDIDKQTSELSKLQDVKARADVYNYLQRLIKLHVELFSSTWTIIIAFASLAISIIALLRSH